MSTRSSSAVCPCTCPQLQQPRRESTLAERAMRPRSSSVVGPTALLVATIWCCLVDPLSSSAFVGIPQRVPSWSVSQHVGILPGPGLVGLRGPPHCSMRGPRTTLAITAMVPPFGGGGGRYDESQGMTELERARERLKSIKQGNLGPRAELGSTLPLGTSDPPISYTRSSIDDESTTGAVDGAGASVVSSPSQEQVLPEPSWRPRVVSHPCVDRSFCE